MPTKQKQPPAPEPRIALLNRVLPTLRDAVRAFDEDKPQLARTLVSHALTMLETGLYDPFSDDPARRQEPMSGPDYRQLVRQLLSEITEAAGYLADGKEFLAVGRLRQSLNEARTHPLADIF